MYCKYCGTELEKNNTVCAACGRDTADKPKRVKKKKPLTEKQMKIIVASAAGAIVAIAFVIMAICGVFTPKEGVFLKDSYSVSASDAAENADTQADNVGVDSAMNSDDAAPAQEPAPYPPMQDTYDAYPPDEGFGGGGFV